MRTVSGVTEMHYGIDLAPSGSNVSNVRAVATVRGAVKRIVTNIPNTYTGLNISVNTTGNIIEIETPDKFLVRYYHLAHGSFCAALKVGSAVGVGDELATVGRTGRASGVHLHYEFADPKGNRFDPEPYLANDRQFSRAGEVERIAREIADGSDRWGTGITRQKNIFVHGESMYGRGNGAQFTAEVMARVTELS
jgi:murein DD-endopeptidase MepM/ murein hydrolase activator NlpD